MKRVLILLSNGFEVLEAAAFIVSVLLHNVVYGLCIQWFGADFWSRSGLNDEPVFFFIAVLLCPIAFLVGATGSIFLAAKNLRRKKQPSGTQTANLDGGGKVG